MKKYLILILFICMFFILSCEYLEGRNINDIILGKTIKIFSKILNEERPIQIHLPEGYAENSLSYPVLITLDGERFFKTTTTTVEFLARYGHLPPMIVVGVPNTNRNRDFSFEKSNLKEKFGADHFIQFLKEELIPYIDKNYRTNPYRIIKGWCATGAFCIFILFTQPSLFNAYFASSPYLVNEANYIFELIKEYHLKNYVSKRFLYFSVGERDRPDAKYKVPKFAQLLKKKNFSSLEWGYDIFQNQDHYTIDLFTLHRALEMLFKDMIQVKKIVKDGFRSGKERLKQLAKQFGFKETFPEKTLARMGYVLMNQELFKDAVCLFKITAEFYPDSYLTYENLGEAYMYYGNKNLAISNLEKSQITIMQKIC
jgi:predicted alpha/beta superfamily hydrolase